MNRIADMNLLLDCSTKCIAGSNWKESVHRFEANQMLNCYRLKRDLETRTYTPSLGKQFVQIERGKARPIKAPTIQDRVVHKALNQAVILPGILPRLIYDNGASVKGKGNDFGRRRFETHIHKHFAKRGDNGGYVLFGDFSKYFDNLLHDRIKALFREFTQSEEEYDLLCAILDSFSPDVSYMSDEEYAQALGNIYNSLEHLHYEGGRVKTLAKGCDIGAELSQTSGIYYPHQMDTFFKVVRALEYYGRFMDDTYFVGDTMEEMLSYKEDLKQQSKALGIFLNERKTHIMRLDRPFVWLKVKYTLTPTGRLIRNLDHSAIVRERKRIKYLANQLYSNEVSISYVKQCYLCWRGSKKHLDCHRSLESLDALYRELIGPLDTYKI